MKTILGFALFLLIWLPCCFIAEAVFSDAPVAIHMVMGYIAGDIGMELRISYMRGWE